MSAVRIRPAIAEYLKLLAKRTGHSQQWHADNALDAYIVEWEAALESGTVDEKVKAAMQQREGW